MLITKVSINFLFLSKGVGALLRTQYYADKDRDGRIRAYVKFPGELLMRMLKMLILPLVMSTMISGLASIDIRSVGKIGSRAMTYYLTTTVMATILGRLTWDFLVNTI